MATNLPSSLPEAAFYRLPYATVGIRGADRNSFLNGLTTADIAHLPDSGIIPSLFLNTDGKVLWFSLILKTADQLIIGIEQSHVPTLRQYLDYFHIREDVTFSQDPHIGFFLFFGAETSSDLHLTDDVPAIKDRSIIYVAVPGQQSDNPWFSGAFPEISAELFAEAAIGLNYPPAALNEKRKYPHELGLERYVSFTKGCFIGQEPVSRMQHKFSATKRMVHVSAEKPLTRDDNILMAGKPAGSILMATSIPYRQRFFGIARLKSQALGNQQTLQTESGIPITVTDLNA